jgi:zinc protease
MGRRLRPAPACDHLSIVPAAALTMRLALVLFLLAASALSALAAPALPTPLREVEGIREYRLPNGLQVLLVPDPSRPTVTVNVTYHVGSRMEGYGETGMAHLLEHLMFKATRLHANVGAELSRRGMEFNGSTTADRTNYFETFPADPALLAWALRTEADRMTGAKVSRKDLDTEMTVVRNEMEAGENNAVGILVQRTQAAAYQWHSYGRDTIGARADVENVDIPHLQAFYRRHYQPDNATLIVAGAFDTDSALREIVAAFGRLPRPARVIAPTWTLEPVQEGERLVTLKRSGGEQAVYAAYHIPALASRDYAAFEVLSIALADTPNGRLHKRLVEAGKATQVFGWASRNAEPGLLGLGVLMKKDDAVDAAQTLLVQTVEGLADEPVTAEELQRAQRQWAKDLDKTLAEPQRLCLALSEAIGAGDWRLLFSLRDRMQALTLDEVNAAARSWIIASNRTLGRYLATESPQRSPLAPRVAAAEALKDFKPRPALAAGEVFKATPAHIDARTERYTLPSGLKVALLRKKTRGETVELQLQLHFGSAASLRGQRTAAALVGGLLPLGTRNRTRAEISDAFDGLKTDWRISSHALSGASAGLTTQRANLVPALALLAEVLREPAFPEGEFDQKVRQDIADLESAAAEPDAVAGRALAALLSVDYAADDVRHAGSIAESIAALQALQRDAVIAFYGAHWGADHGELAVVGDFDPVELKAAIAEHLGSWTSGQPYERVPQPPSHASGRRLQAQLGDKPNAVALGVLELPLGDEHADYAALRLAVHVLGAGGFDSRLLTRLRQKDGLSYGVGASLRASSFEPAARLDFYAVFAPENRVRVERGFSEELQRFVKAGISEAELGAAKKAMDTEAATWRANDSAVAGAWTGHLERGRSFRWNAQLDARAAALTLEQVNAAIRRWIHPEQINWSLAGDFDKTAPPP